MSTFYPSISAERRHEDFTVQVARGQIPGHRNVTVFGFNPDVDTTEVSIWPHTGIISRPASAVNMKVSSSSANDTAAGSGARTVVIQGLDASFNEVTETVTLNGQTAVTMSTAMVRINYAYVATAGSSLSAEGDIYIGTGTVTSGVPATVYNLIKLNYNNTVTGHYTVPAGHTAYIVQGLFSSGQAGGTNQVQGRLLTCGESGIRNTAAVTTLNNGVANYTFEYPVAVPEKTDIEATAIGSSSNNGCSSLFILLLIKGPTAGAPGTPWN
jgi:hypothetical protein